MSTVITTLIIILLVLVATGILWVVVSNLINSSSEQVQFQGLTIRLEVQKVLVEDSGSIDVLVERLSGKGDITGIKFVVSDGVNFESFEEDTTISELSEETFTLDYEGIVKGITVAPIFESKSGKEFVGKIVNKKEFTSEEIIESLGGVSWWKLDGNANDEIGGNGGSCGDCPEFIADLERGKVASFDYTNKEFISFEDNLVDVSNDDFSISIWVNSSGGSPIINPRIFGIKGVYGLQILWLDKKDIGVRIDNGGVNVHRLHTTSNVMVDSDQWYHIVLTVSSATIDKIYVNGEDENLEVIRSYSGTGVSSIGRGHNNLNYNWNGLIDDVIVFDRVLSEKEVEALYRLDSN
ncbi:MAG: LamG domain-containing protein [archaeon]